MPSRITRFVRQRARQRALPAGTRSVVRDLGLVPPGTARPDGEETLRMIFLGLIVVLAAVVAGVAVVLDNTGSAQMTVFGDEVPGITAQWQVFMAGAVVAIVLMAGVTVATLGFRRAMNVRRELRDLRDEHEESLQTLELERRKLQQALAQARRGMDDPAAAPAQRMAPN